MRNRFRRRLDTAPSGNDLPLAVQRRLYLLVKQLCTPVEGNDNGYVRLRLADQTVIRAPRTDTGNDALSVGVRPEKIRLHEADVPAPGGHNALDGTIVDASYLGVSTQYQVEAKGGARLTVYEQNVERATRSELWSPGTRVLMTWLPDHSFLVRDELDSGRPSSDDPSDGAVKEGEP